MILRSWGRCSLSIRTKNAFIPMSTIPPGWKYRIAASNCDAIGECLCVSSDVPVVSYWHSVDQPTSRKSTSQSLHSAVLHFALTNCFFETSKIRKHVAKFTKRRDWEATILNHSESQTRKKKHFPISAFRCTTLRAYELLFLSVQDSLARSEVSEAKGLGSYDIKPF